MRRAGLSASAELVVLISRSTEPFSKLYSKPNDYLFVVFFLFRSKSTQNVLKVLFSTCDAVQYWNWVYRTLLNIGTVRWIFYVYSDGSTGSTDRTSAGGHSISRSETRPRRFDTVCLYSQYCCRRSAKAWSRVKTPKTESHGRAARCSETDASAGRAGSVALFSVHTQPARTLAAGRPQLTRVLKDK